MRHPSGCAKIVHVHRRGWGFFGTFTIMYSTPFNVESYLIFVNIVEQSANIWFFVGVIIFFGFCSILCLFGGYLLAGIVYRYFVLKVRGVDVRILILFNKIAAVIFPYATIKQIRSSLVCCCWGVGGGGL